MSPSHGTRYGYASGCRCDECRAGNAARKRDYDRHKRRVRYGIEAPKPPALIDATEARNHLIWLESVGVGTRVVEQRTGVARVTMWKIRTGQSRLTTPSVADRILSVGRHHAQPGARVDATDTWRKINELLKHGWTRRDIARAITGNPNAEGLQIRKICVLQSTADKVAALHAEALRPILRDREISTERRRYYRNRDAA